MATPRKLSKIKYYSYNTHYLSPITYHPLPITYYLLPITHYLSPITYYLSPITYYLLPITHYPLEHPYILYYLLSVVIFSSRGLKVFLVAPQIGQLQSSGISVKAVPATIPESGSPITGS